MHRISAVVLVVLAGLFLTACGAEDEITLEDQVPAEVRDAAAGNGEADNGEPPADAETVTYEAYDLGFNGPTDIPAGTVTFVLENTGNLPHDIVIEELGNEMVAEADGGETDQGTVTLEPGSYTLYCSVPGHRSAMEMTVEAS